MVMATPSPQQVGREFVRQYYTILHEKPEVLHRFYNTGSTFVHGGVDSLGNMEEVVTGQVEIDRRIQQLNFRNCHTKIRQIDSQATISDAVVVQVTGELSNNGEPMRRFMQTFVLVPQTPKNFYVHNDIFRYQDEVYHDNSDSESEDQQSETNTRTNATQVSAQPTPQSQQTQLQAAAPPPPPIQQQQQQPSVTPVNYYQQTLPQQPVVTPVNYYQSTPPVVTPVNYYQPPPPPPVQIGVQQLLPPGSSLPSVLAAAVRQQQALDSVPMVPHLIPQASLVQQHEALPQREKIIHNQFVAEQQQQQQHHQPPPPSQTPLQQASYVQPQEQLNGHSNVLHAQTFNIQTRAVSNTSEVVNNVELNVITTTVENGKNEGIVELSVVTNEVNKAPSPSVSTQQPEQSSIVAIQQQQPPPPTSTENKSWAKIINQSNGSSFTNNANSIQPLTRATLNTNNLTTSHESGSNTNRSNSTSATQNQQHNVSGAKQHYQKENKYFHTNKQQHSNQNENNNFNGTNGGNTQNFSSGRSNRQQMSGNSGSNRGSSQRDIVPQQQQQREQRQSVNENNNTNNLNTNSTSLEENEKKFRPHPDNHQIFVGNLQPDITEDELKKYFGTFGNVVEVRINTNSKQQSGRRLPNYGFIVFDAKESVESVLKSSKSNNLTYKNEKGIEHRLNIEEKRAKQNRDSGNFKSNRINRSSSNGPRNKMNSGEGVRSGGGGGGGGGGNSGGGGGTDGHNVSRGMKRTPNNSNNTGAHNQNYAATGHNTNNTSRKS